MIVGMDVHRNRTQVCVVDGEGKEVRNRNVVNRPQGPSQGAVGAAQGDQGGLRGGVWRGLGWPSYARTSAWRRTWRTPRGVGRSLTRS